MLLPIDLRIEKVCHNAITRITTLPKEHPLHVLAKKRAKGRVKRHWSPLHNLTRVFGVNPSKIEKILPVCTHPKKRGLQAVQIDIPPNKDESKRADINSVEQVKVYLDGLAHGSKVRATAILRREGKQDHILKMHLSTTEQHMVYEVELVGMILGLYLIKTEKRSKVKCVLNVDNQAALVVIKSEPIRSTSSSSPPAGGQAAGGAKGE